MSRTVVRYMHRSDTSNASFLFLWASLCSLGYAPLGAATDPFTYSPVTVMVKDAETGKPIGGASVSLFYGGGDMRWPKPDYVFGVHTSPDGTVTTKVAAQEELQWDVEADGYRQLILTMNAFGTVPANLDFLVYRTPDPHLTISVPKDYHGPLRINFHKVSNPIQEQPGKREFAFRASLAGYVGIDASPLLQNLGLETYFLAFLEDNGTPIPQSTEQTLPSARAIRLMRRKEESSDIRLLFALGTAQDAEAINAVINPRAPNLPDGFFSEDPKAFDDFFDESKPPPQAAPEMLPLHLSIIVPKGYRGPVRILLTPVLNSKPDDLTKRNFSFHTSSTGYVEISAPPQLFGINDQHISIQYDDGTELPSMFGVPPSTVTFRYEAVVLAPQGRKLLFELGSAMDANAVHEKIFKTSRGLNEDPIDHQIFDAIFDEPVSTKTAAPAP